MLPSNYLKKMAAPATRPFRSAYNKLAEKPREKRRGLLILQGFVVSIYAIFCSIFSDTISQNDYDFLMLPMKHSMAVPLSIGTMDNITSSSNPDDGRLYIFVYDCSQSTDNGGADQLSWYPEAINYLKNPSYDISSKEDVSRIAIFYLIKRLAGVTDQHEDANQNDQFAVWAVCKTAMELLPGDGRRGRQGLAATAPQLKRSIEEFGKKIDQRVKEDGKSKTNFIELFNELQKKYRPEGTPAASDYDSPQFVVTILSDFRHDGERPQENAEARAEVVQELRKSIGQLSLNRTAINMISVPGKRPEKEKIDIRTIIEEKFKWYRLNKSEIDDSLVEEARDILHTTSIAREPLIVYYEDPLYINSRFHLETSAGDILSISIPSEIEHPITEKLSLQYGFESPDSKNRQARMSGRIISGSEEVRIPMAGNNRLVFQYEGPLPVKSEDLIMKIPVDSQQRNYLVPIRFIKRLPRLESWTMLLLQSAFVVTLIPLAITAIAARLDTRKNKARLQNLAPFPPSELAN